jgi:recombination protein RecA
MPPKEAPSQRVKVASSSDKLMDSLVAGLKRIAPREKKDASTNTGSVEVCRTNKSVLSKVRYILKTGIRSFDRKTGGIPFGRVTEIYGLESCGKTGLVMRCAIRAQMREIYEKIKDPDAPTKTILQQIPDDADVTVVFVDNEQSVDEDGKTIIDGVALNAVLLRCDTVDQLFKSVDYTINKIADHERETKRQQFVVIIVDTIAGTSSKEEMTQDWGKEDYSRQPKQLRRAFRRMTRKINRCNVAMICTNQVSDSYAASAVKKGGKFMLPQDRDFSTFGGRALKYYSTLRVFMQKVCNWSLIRKSRFPDGMLVSFHTSKNRQVKPLRDGRMVLVFSNQLESDEEEKFNYTDIEAAGGIISRSDGTREMAGGFNDVFSLLEDLIFLGFATIAKESGTISFKFDKWGIPMRTFGEKSAPFLEEDAQVEERPGFNKRDPYIEAKVEWPEFYREHEADFNAMWERAVQYTFENEGLSEYASNDDGHDDDDDSED